MRALRTAAWEWMRPALAGILVLVSAITTATVGAANAGPALAVNVGAHRYPISPDIYGMNFADATLAQELRTPVDRRGGNATSRYNWQTNIYNTGNDYYFENIAGGQTADQFVDADRAHGTQSIITVPLIGYVSKTSPTSHPFTCGFSVATYGTQQSTDPFDSNCGNGVRADSSLITGDPLDTSIATDAAFVQNWVAHFVSRYGAASAGGVRYYDLDNEPVLWNSTHRDVHPNALTYDELKAQTLLYAPAVKAGDASAKTLGPSDWGWLAYQDTGVPQDRANHGDTPLAQWYLQQMQAYEQAHGTRILDYFDEHYYPAASGFALSPAGDAATQALRLRSTRSLWDPTYVDESYIGQAIQVIPTFHTWVDTSYPGTKIAVSEYNFGGLESINGALTEADVLGIFGRERVDLATMWAPPTTDQPGAYAFRMYRNYDGHGGAFGDVSVQSTSADQGQLAIYGAQRSNDGALTVMVINKTRGDLTSALSLSGFTSAGTAQVYRYAAANPTAIVPQANLPVTASGLTATFAANSISLIIVSGSRQSVACRPPRRERSYSRRPRRCRRDDRHRHSAFPRRFHLPANRACRVEPGREASAPCNPVVGLRRASLMLARRGDRDAKKGARGDEYGPGVGAIIPSFRRRVRTPSPPFHHSHAFARNSRPNISKTCPARFAPVSPRSATSHRSNRVQRSRLPAAAGASRTSRPSSAPSSRN